ncbi:MAG: UDP-3-O-(3-hydroxymyristoyl)glucosamine N-acyltransferase [Rhizomicrobium sp.]
MADPRFYDNRGPYTLAEVCAKAGAAVPAGADDLSRIDDLASLSGAVAAHLSFYADKRAATEFSRTRAGFCFVPAKTDRAVESPPQLVTIPCAAVQHAFATAANMFYPEASLDDWSRQRDPVDPSAEIGERVVLSAGVVVGPQAQIGDDTRIGPNTVIGRGVTVGRGCEIGSNVSISHAYLGDQLLILSGAQIGQPGFGFASDGQGHIKIPQLGRVIVQDKVEIGAGVTIDRGALGDTVIGEGTKIDNLVQIGHNVHIGRHCVIVSQTGISGSTTLGDFVVLGGQCGISDHCRIGNGARLGGRSAMIIGQELEGGRDYAGTPAKPVKDWIRELHAVAAMIRKPKRNGHD